MKKAMAVLLAAAVMLAGCASEESGGGGARKPAAAAESYTSSVFGRKVDYAAFTPSEGLSLPVPAEKISGEAQIDGRLYLLVDGGVHFLDVETGGAGLLFETSATLIAANGGKLFTYSPEESVLAEYDQSGSLTAELSIKIDGVGGISGLVVTDGFFVFNCDVAGAMTVEPHLYVYSRETGEQLLSKGMQTTGIYPYKDNKIFAVTVGSVFPSVDLNVFDAETGKSKFLRNLGDETDPGARPGVAYCPKTDTVLVYGHGAGDGAPVCITEFSLDDGDKMILNRYYFDITYETKFFLSVCENVAAAISTADGLRIYDYLNPPESLTVLCHHLAGAEMIYRFEQQTGILIKAAYTDYDKLALKLMAGEDDFDLYSGASDFQNFVNAGVCADLSAIESLNSRLSKNAAVGLAASLDGRFFAVPTLVRNYFTEEYYPEDGGPATYSKFISEIIYLADNVDVADGRYSDSDGKELYKLFKFIGDNPEGNMDKMPFGSKAEVYSASDMFMLNPRSKHRDSAVKFLEFVFDAYNGDAPGVVPENEQYPHLETAEGCYAEWRCRPLEIIMPIMDARSKINNSDNGLSGGELKKMAREAAAEVAMRMGE